MKSMFIRQQDLDDALLQGVHIRVALGDVLLDEPPAGGHVRAANLGREEMVEGAGLLGGANLALHVLKVPAFLQLLDDGGAGGRGSDAAVLALLSVVLLLEDGLYTMERISLVKGTLIMRIHQRTYSIACT